jgi:hypothetical protein
MSRAGLESHRHPTLDAADAASQERAVAAKLHADADLFLKGNRGADTSKLHPVMIHYDDPCDATKQVKSRNEQLAENQQTQKDFAIVDKALTTDYGIDKGSMQTLASDSSKPANVRESAARLLKNWDKNKDLMDPSDNYPDGLMNAASTTKGFDRRNGELKTDKEDKDSAAKAQDDLRARQDILDKAQIKAGDGPYQVAEKLLKTLHGKHVDYREVKALSDVLIRHFQAENPGRDVKVFKTTDHLITAKNFEKIMDDVSAQAYGGGR